MASAAVGFCRANQTTGRQIIAVVTRSGYLHKRSGPLGKPGCFTCPRDVTRFPAAPQQPPGAGGRGVGGSVSRITGGGERVLSGCSHRRKALAKKNCPGCQALRLEASKPGAPLADFLVRVALHERSAECREPVPARKRPKA